MEPLKEIKFLVIHHSQRDIDSPKDIKKRHIKRGWETIGYHYLIKKDGKISKGRSKKYVGAHVLGHNKSSLGICLIGNLDESLPTMKQLKTLFKLLRKLSKKYKVPVENILGHREFSNVTKTCPGNLVRMDLIRNAIKPNS